MKFAVYGDLVFGLASAAPPKAFVGEIGDEASDAAAGLSRDLRRSGGGVQPSQRIVTLRGRRVATQRATAMELGPDGGTAFPLTTLPKVNIRGEQCLVHDGLFQCAPTGSLKAIAYQQQIAGADPAVAGPAAGGLSPGDEASPAAGGSSRSDFSPPSAMHTMLSRCSTARLADLVPPQYAHLVGDPVDVASGAVVTDAVDIERVAPPLAFRRHYASNRSETEGPLGFGWSHNFDQAVWLEVGRVVHRDAHGRQIEFDCLALRNGVTRAGDVLHDPTGQLQLRCHGHHHWEVVGPEQTLHFAPIPGTSAQDTDRGLARVTKIVVRGQPLTELAYDSHARLHTVAVDGNVAFEFQYDQHDHIRAINRDAALFSYSEAGDLVAATDPQRRPRNYEYAGHLLVGETNRRGGTFYYAYDGHGAHAKCIRAWGSGGRLDRVLSYEGDATVVTDSLGHRWVYERQPIGVVRRVVDPHGDGTTYRYDDALRLVEIGFSDGTALSDAYGDEGRLVKQRGRDGATWRMTYDAAGHLVEGFDPQDGQWRFDYDLHGRLARVQDPEGHVTRLEYSAGQLHRIVDPLGRATEIELGRGDEVTRVAFDGGSPVDFQYDAQGRLVGSRSADRPDARWGYDPAGRLIAYACGTDFMRLARDAEGSVLGIERPDQTWTLRRDPFGSIVGATDQTRSLSYEYDTEGRLIQASGSGKARWEARRDERGLVDAAVLDGTDTCVVVREPKTGRVARMTWPQDAVSLAWDEGGRITEIHDANGARRFGYRADGLVSMFATDDSASTLTRNARGVVVRQEHGDRVLSSAHIDHCGKRYGFEVDDVASFSYLWASDGDLERIAATAGTTFDLSVWRQDGRTRVRHGDLVADVVPVTEDASCDGPADALLRPRFGRADEPLVWDEDRLLLVGDRVRVTDPRTGDAVATIVEGTLNLHGATDHDPVPRLPAPRQAAYDALFPAMFGSFGILPLSLLRRTLAVAVWNPEARPWAGTHPWDPDQWQVRDSAAELASNRLDQATLMRLLSPFPRPALLPTSR